MHALNTVVRHKRAYYTFLHATGTLGAFIAMAWGSLGVVYGDLGEGPSSLPRT